MCVLCIYDIEEFHVKHVIILCESVYFQIPGIYDIEDIHVKHVFILCSSFDMLKVYQIKTF